jgi:hypothetical protein
MIVSASVMLFEKVCQQFLPTPSRSHYAFNLRGLADGCTGIRRARLEVIYSVELMVDL